MWTDGNGRRRHEDEEYDAPDNFVPYTDTAYEELKRLQEAAKEVVPMSEKKEQSECTPGNPCCGNMQIWGECCHKMEQPAANPAQLSAREFKLNGFSLLEILGRHFGQTGMVKYELVPEVAAWAEAYRDASQRPHAEETLLAAIVAFRQTAGFHEGEHNSSLMVCSKCTESYVMAEAELDRAIAAFKEKL